jgi:hypothetical protein
MQASGYVDIIGLSREAYTVEKRINAQCSSAFIFQDFLIICDQVLSKKAPFQTLQVIQHQFKVEHTQPF